MENHKKVGINPNVSFLTTLRNSGYNNYTAIADIVDNSLDNEVESKNVRIEFESDSKGEFPFKFIKIHDDGNGMDYETLVEALKLGSNTGKSRKLDLGSYGTGMKAAALSMGRKFIVKTKSENDQFYIAEFDLDELINSGIFEVPICIGNDSEYQEFMNDVQSENGTSIVITKLDSITNTSTSQFGNKLLKDFSLFYKIFIEEQDVKILINKKIVIPFDPMYRKENFSKRLSSLNEKFEYDNKDFTFNAFYLEKMDKNNLKEINGDIIDDRRNHNNSGLYVYRNNRLVGAGLDLGILGRHGDGYLNGLRIELLVDGDSDDLFGSTFIKMIHEKDKKEINQGFRDTCKTALAKYISAVRSLEKIDKSTDLSDEDKEGMNRIMSGINKNKLIKVNKVGKNNKEKEPTEKKPTQNKGKNKFSTRKREDIFADWKFESFGESGVLFKTTFDGGKHVIHMNTDHVFWVEFLKDTTNETKGVVARMFVAMALSLDSIGYYDDAEKEVLLQEYMLEMSSNLRKLIIG